MDLPGPFLPVDGAEKLGLERELQRELAPGHSLYQVPVSLIARRHDQDEFLFQILDGSSRVAQVHLTWATQEKPPWPWTTIFANFSVWAELVRQDDIDTQRDEQK